MSPSARSVPKAAKQLKTQLLRLRKTAGFIDWRKASKFARKLEALLADLRSTTEDPADGVDAVAVFFESDSAVFEQCDDSGGNIGDVFRFPAREMFVHYAQQLADKASLADRLMKLYEHDAYGVRGDLIDSAHEFLPPNVLRDLAQQLWAKSESCAPDSYELRHWMIAVESVARQIKDAHLFEKARRTAWPNLSTAACLDIAQAYLDAGEAQTALSWVQRIPEKESFHSDERDRLLLAIHETMGDGEAIKEIAWRIFRGHRSKETLGTLLAAIGDDQRERVIEEETRHVLTSPQFCYCDVKFLLDVGDADAAERYILQHAGDLNGDLYYSLLPLAKAMEKHKRWLAAVAVYRALLESNLTRGISKYYHHGVRYLKKLDALAAKVNDWQDTVPHETYKEGLLKTHSRKSSFWSRYNGEHKSRKSSRQPPWTIVR